MCRGEELVSFHDGVWIRDRRRKSTALIVFPNIGTRWIPRLNRPKLETCFQDQQADNQVLDMSLSVHCGELRWSVGVSRVAPCQHPAAHSGRPSVLRIGRWRRNQSPHSTILDPVPRCGLPSSSCVCPSPHSASAHPWESRDKGTNEATMAAFVKALNAKIRSNPVSDYVCSTRMYPPLTGFFLFASWTGAPDFGVVGG